MTGVDGLVAALVDVARAGAGAARRAGVGCESPGVALRALDRPGAGAGRCGRCGADEASGCYCGLDAGACPECERSHGPHYRGRCEHGGGAEVLDGRALAVGRLSAASDDAADLAEGFGLDVRLELAKGGREGRIRRLARVAFRCADQCRRLRELADAIQEADADPGEACPRCGGALRPVAGLAEVVGCGACRETWHRPGGGQ